MSKRFGIVMVVAGLLLLAAAMGLYLYNDHVSREAGEHAQAVMEQIQTGLPSPTPSAAPEAAVPSPKTTMPVVEIDGNAYVGYVSVPVLGIELPVMADLSYDKLRLAPCRHEGATYSKDLVIAAHNYDKHFGGLKELQIGDTITFTDMDGDMYSYAVCVVETVAPTAVEQVLESEYDLVLYTCTYGGKSRVAVFSEMIE